jgi:hypothetical protein
VDAKTNEQLTREWQSVLDWLEELQRRVVALERARVPNERRSSTLTTLEITRMERDAAIRERDEARAQLELWAQAVADEFASDQDAPMQPTDVARLVRAVRWKARAEDAKLHAACGYMATVYTEWLNLTDGQRARYMPKLIEHVREVCALVASEDERKEESGHADVGKARIEELEAREKDLVALVLKLQDHMNKGCAP